MDDFKIRRPTKGRFIYVAGREPLFHERSLIVDYDNMVERSRGYVTDIWYNSAVDDWEYTFRDGSRAFEHELVQNNAWEVEVIREDRRTGR